jgi:hypothetical protein
VAESACSCPPDRWIAVIDTGLRVIGGPDCPLGMGCASLLRLCVTEQKWLKSIGRLDLPNCRDLLLHNNHLTSIPDLSGCPRVQRLWLWSNDLESLRGVGELAEIKELWVQDNRLTSLQGVEHLSSLQALSVAANPITSLVDLQKLTHLPRLKSLSFQEAHFGPCPVTHAPDYKAVVVSHMPRLRQLDGRPIRESDRDVILRKIAEEAERVSTEVARLHEIGQSEAAMLDGQSHQVSRDARESELATEEGMKTLQAVIQRGQGAVDAEAARQERSRDHALAISADSLDAIDKATSEWASQWLTGADVDAHKAALYWAELEASTEAFEAASLNAAKEVSEGAFVADEVSSHSPEFRAIASAVSLAWQVSPAAPGADAEDVLPPHGAPFPTSVYKLARSSLGSGPVDLPAEASTAEKQAEALLKHVRWSVWQLGSIQGLIIAASGIATREGTGWAEAASSVVVGAASAALTAEILSAMPPRERIFMDPMAQVLASRAPGSPINIESQSGIRAWTVLLSREATAGTASEGATSLGEVDTVEEALGALKRAGWTIGAMAPNQDTAVVVTVTRPEMSRRGKPLKKPRFIIAASAAWWSSEAPSVGAPRVQPELLASLRQSTEEAEEADAEHRSSLATMVHELGVDSVTVAAVKAAAEMSSAAIAESVLGGAAHVSQAARAGASTVDEGGAVDRGGIAMVMRGSSGDGVTPMEAVAAAAGAIASTAQAVALAIASGRDPDRAAAASAAEEATREAEGELAPTREGIARVKEEQDEALRSTMA